ncbi:chymotrypsin-1-like [Choristoneura fumiferana]|uniref:chymotrypsin-1-like n=1 Tax=Choristoneura fumiferana TaxID=7141 RepID=UPI003D15B0C4
MSAAILYKIITASVILMLVNCPSTHSFMEGRIVGGETAKMKHYPHSVYLDAACDGGEWHCGASILNQKILLTAAHCVMGCDEDWAISAFAGNEVIDEMKLYRKISRYIIHPKYETTSFTHDIALLLMSKHLPFGTTIKRVIIKNRFPKDKDLTIAGWGTIKESPETVRATRLKAVKQKLLSKKDCRKVCQNAIIEGVIDGMLCAKYNMENRPSHGDSGSALMTSDGTQVGLVSFRTEKTPDIIVYTNVTYYYQWIRSNAKRLYCNG